MSWSHAFLEASNAGPMRRANAGTTVDASSKVIKSEPSLRQACDRTTTPAESSRD
jgi:hypothetical protein